MTAIRGLFCLMSLVASVLASPPPGKPPQKLPQKSPNILLITLDTTRADRMGFLGSKRGLTPNLDALARDSAVFTHAYSQAPLTPTSHATILTGTYPQFHQVNDFRLPLAKDLPYAPDVLHAHGYRTAAFVGSVVLDPATNYAPGFDRGFDTYNAGFDPEAIRQKGRFETIERRGNVVVTRARAWLTHHPKGPFFLWVHLYDAHDPYDPPEPYKSRYASEPYDGEIAYEDAAVGRLLAQFKARGLYEDAVIAVMSDHGESLGTHGEDTHGIFLYDETIQVPLVIKLPRKNAGDKSTTKQTTKRIDDKVELVDVMPTLLQAAGVAVPTEVQGQSLMGLLTTATTPADSGTAVEAWHDRPAYAETDYPRTAFGWSALRSLRTGKYLYVQAPRQELYDEVADAKAEHNLAGESTAVADTLKARLDSIRQQTANNREAPKATVDPTAQEKLAALGYVSGGSNASNAGSAAQGADPKDKIEISNLNHQANALRQSGRPADAVPLLQQLLAKDPNMPNIYGELGECYLDLTEFQKALPVLRKAKELDPESSAARLRLAKALMGVGDFAAAVPELEFAVARIPSYAEAHLFLEMAYARTNRIPETIKECQTVLEFFPDHFGSYLILGRFLELSGDFAGAVPKLKKASALNPNAPEPHLFLADAYTQLGKQSEAAREKAAAKRLAANHKE
ncbi:MAG TPA: sulfatase-like hydrolase/transferase [Terriglobales bacterium]|jgi:arylsulfatase A-like enzyme/cytochrome c-type biogenesis protein CcmH/NrfG|nr:sulfatase-like hydrolase/transferase [Terriglobales bacterium]